MYFLFATMPPSLLHIFTNPTYRSTCDVLGVSKYLNINTYTVIFLKYSTIVFFLKQKPYFLSYQFCNAFLPAHDADQRAEEGLGFCLSLIIYVEDEKSPLCGSNQVTRCEFNWTCGWKIKPKSHGNTKSSQPSNMRSNRGVFFNQPHNQEPQFTHSVNYKCGGCRQSHHTQILLNSNLNPYILMDFSLQTYIFPLHFFSPSSRFWKWRDPSLINSGQNCADKCMHKLG